MRLWRITDDEYIARMSRFHRNRRVWACVFLVAGVIWSTLAIWFANNLTQQSLEVMNSIAEIDNPTTRDVAALTDETRFFVGFNGCSTCSF